MTRILVVDNYDSFVYTLVSYLRELGAEVDVVRNDAVPAEELETIPDRYAGVLLSPGPGVPAASGICPALIDVAARHRLPLFGVCLGHQALAEVFGATVTHSPTLMHGKTSEVHHHDTSVFAGCKNPLIATRYHSLAVVDSTIDPEIFEITAQTADGVVMAIEHRDAPLFGVQFHPESVLTENGYLLLGNWLEHCGMSGVAERAAGMSPLASAPLSV